MHVFVYVHQLKTVAAVFDAADFAKIDAELDKLYSGLKSGDLSDLESCEKFKRHPSAIAALTLYKNMTGRDFPGSAGQMHHLQASRYGRLCPDCDKPFRTPRARFCAECGYRLSEGEVAGPLLDG